jgi:hypothetical protein
MLQKKKTRVLLLAGLAAFAYYRYSKLSAEQKRDLSNIIKVKGKKLYDQYVPRHIKNMFYQNNELLNFDYGENSDYPG